MSGAKEELGTANGTSKIGAASNGYNSNQVYTVKDYIQEMDNEDQSSYASHSRISQVVGDDISCRPSVFSVRNQGDYATKSSNSPF